MALLDRLFGRPRLRHGVSRVDVSPGQFTTTMAWYSSYMALQQDRIAKLRDYREMQEYSDIARFLMAVADEATQTDRQKNVPIWIVTKNDEVKRQWEEMATRLQIDNRLTAIAENLAHFGEVFFYNAVETSETVDPVHKGIEYVLYDDPENVEPILDEKTRKIVGYRSMSIQPKDKDSQGMMKAWEYTHFRMTGRSLLIESGDSLLLAVRKIWRMLKMMEDATIIYRLVKGPDRFLYKVDTGTLQPAESKKLVEDWKRSLRKRSFINPQTGEFNERYLAPSVEEDIWWPVRQGSTSTVERLSGAGNLPHIEDLLYFRDKLYAGLGAPKSFFSQADGPERGRALAMQDIWFARTVKRVQKALIAGHMRQLDINMAAQNLNPYEDEQRYTLQLHPASNLDEIQELEGVLQKLDAAGKLMDLGTAINAPLDQWFLMIAVDVLQLPSKVTEAIRTKINAAKDVDKDGKLDFTQLAKSTAAEMANNDSDLGKIVDLRESVELELMKRGVLRPRGPVPERGWTQNRDLYEFNEPEEAHERPRSEAENGLRS